MTYLLHDGYLLCDACFAMRDTHVGFTYERQADVTRGFEQDKCDGCWTPILVSNSAAFIAGTKSLPQLMAR